MPWLCKTVPRLLSDFAGLVFTPEENNVSSDDQSLLRTKVLRLPVIRTRRKPTAANLGLRCESFCKPRATRREKPRDGR